MTTLLNPEEFSRRAADLDWLLCDVDGVLTDGGIYYDHRGHTLMRFHVRDGLGLRLAQRAGLKVGFLTGRSSPALERRAADLDIEAVYAGSRDKSATFETFLSQHHTTPRRVAYIGDDLPDLTVLGRCALSFAPADAAPEVRAVAHQVLKSPGGAGALRELVEILLRTRGDWDRVFSPFTFDG